MCAKTEIRISAGSQNGPFPVCVVTLTGVSLSKRFTPSAKGLVAKTGAVIMTTFDVFYSVLLPAPSPALPEAMAGATSMGGYLATARATQLVDIVR